MTKMLAELYRRDRVLTVAGSLHFALLLTMVAAAVVDHRQVLGINVWIKPIKFAASIVIYLWTLAWLLEYVTGPEWCKRLIRWGASLAMFGEITCIAGQSARGVASHFNNATAFDDAVFSVMGLLILFNTVLDILLLALYCRRCVSLPATYSWGIRLGLIGTVFAAAIGGAMLVNGGHTVGLADGTPGLWLVNWSTESGDLRVAHALGLHALQILPLCGYLLSRLDSPWARRAGMATATILYGGVTLWAFWQAIDGQPLIRGPLSVWPSLRPCSVASAPRLLSGQDRH